MKFNRDPVSRTRNVEMTCVKMTRYLVTEISNHIVKCSSSVLFWVCSCVFV